jgi:hypothetical protein
MKQIHGCENLSPIGKVLVLGLLVILAGVLACSENEREILTRPAGVTPMEEVKIPPGDSYVATSESQREYLNPLNFNYRDIGLSDTQDRGIWVTGIGVFEVEPNVAVVKLAVSVLAKTVASSQSQVSRYVSDVQETALTYGVLQKDIQTIGYSIYPEYHYEDVTIGSKRQTKRVLDGYKVTHDMVFKLREMIRGGEIVDALVTAGEDAIKINDISLIHDDTSDAQVVARELAILDATDRANQIATTMGITVGNPVYVREISATTYADPVQQAYAVARAYDESSISTSIMGGVLDITVNVTVVFAIGD